MTSLESSIASMTVPELFDLMTKIMEEIELRLMQDAGQEEEHAGIMGCHS